jgi:hypothetical protein
MPAICLLLQRVGNAITCQWYVNSSRMNLVPDLPGQSDFKDLVGVQSKLADTRAISLHGYLV